MENIHWLGHASFKITGEKTVYIDPYKLSEAKNDADVVLITHEHFDHCSIEDLKKVINENTIVVAVNDCLSKLTGMEFKDTKLVGAGQTLEVEGLKIETVPAYNIDKQFHPKGNDWVGFILTINGKRIYHAGDTDKIPEMANLQNIDVALVPVGGTYTMNAEEAAAAVKEFNPKVAVPIHWGSEVGTKEDAEKFKELAEVDVEILEKE